MKFITDDIGTVVEAMEPVYADGKERPHYYMYGHRLEIANRLLMKGGDPENKHKKYPLVALRMDIPEPISGGMSKYNLNILILTMTEEKWNAEQRMKNIIKPILVPLYLAFLDALYNSGMFSWKVEDRQDQRTPPHTPIIRPYWGTAKEEGNVDNLFNDPIDAIEIIDLEIMRSKNCGVTL